MRRYRTISAVVVIVFAMAAWAANSGRVSDWLIGRGLVVPYMIVMVVGLLVIALAIFGVWFLLRED